MKKKIIYAISAFIVILSLIIFLTQRASSPAVASTEVNHGEFVIKVIEAGEVTSINSATVSAPRIRGRLQIVWLIKDGSNVKKGDVLVRFDKEELQQEMLKSLSDLKIAQNEIEKKLADIESQRRTSQIELDNTKLQYEEALLETKKADMIAKIEAEKNKLRYEQADRRYRETLKKMDSQGQSDEADLNVLYEKKAKAEADYKIAKRSLEEMTRAAPKDGLVVLKEIWKGSAGMSKVQEGDTVWPGVQILEIPDLSAMEVKVYLNEVDVGKVKPEQEAIIRIDSFPDKIFNGKVERAASIGTKKDWDAKVKTFETVISLNELDPRMRPGMTCMVDIITERIPDVLSIPIESVFEKEGKTIAYVMGSRNPKRREVVLGKRNNTHIVVTKGLSPGDKIALRDPFAGPEAEESSHSKKGSSP
ncbi:MAG: efflux RND transporter periplasmic adaptor subunit [Candidatus Aminicenantes bacterium]|nr:efflux RND transporter periplasmic adaptor subunit [Candidatus Aminicenantes bacterium]